MKTARITFLGTPDFKSMLETEASAKSVSVGELIRAKFAPSEEEKLVSELAAELKREAVISQNVLREALAEAQQAITELRAHRKDA